MGELADCRRPAMNALLPAPVRMTPCTAVSSRASSKAVRMSVHVGVFKAFEHLGPIDGHVGDAVTLFRTERSRPSAPSLKKVRVSRQLGGEVIVRSSSCSFELCEVLLEALGHDLRHFRPLLVICWLVAAARQTKALRPVMALPRIRFWI